MSLRGTTVSEAETLSKHSNTIRMLGEKLHGDVVFGGNNHVVGLIDNGP